MGVFGTNDFGSPFGASDPNEVFGPDGQGQYEFYGFSSRAGADGFSGLSIWGGSGCSNPGIEFLPWAPTLVFPLNYDVLAGKADIEWREAIPHDACGGAVTYEIQFTSSFSVGSGWRTLASGIPSGTQTYEVDFSKLPYTEDGGVRIRAVDQNQLASRWSSSIVPFTVANHPPNPVKILFPTQGTAFDSHVNVAWKEPVIADPDGHDVTYRLDITYTASANSGWQTLAGAAALPRGTGAFVFDAFELGEGADYAVRVVPVDSLGAEGAAATVRFAVRHQGNFLVDTEPPVGRAVINGGAPLASDHRVKMDFSAEDRTTGVRYLRIKNADDPDWGDWDVFVPQKFWDLTATDGLKRVLVQFMDYAGNVSTTYDCEVFSRCISGYGDVNDLQSGADRLYAGFDKNGSVVEYAFVPKEIFQATEESVTAMAWLDKDLYVAGYNTSTASTTIYRYRSATEEIATVSGRVNAMAAFLSGLYVGLDTGYIVEVLGGSIQYPSSPPALDPIVKMKVSGGLLTAIAGNSCVTYNGAAWVRSEL